MSTISESTEPNELKKREIEEVYPLLSFHYGFSFKDVATMPRWARRIYVKALPRLLATKQIMAIEAASYPYMKDGARRTMMRSLDRKARQSRRVQAPPRKMEDMHEVGIKVVKVGPDGQPLKEAA